MVELSVGHYKEVDPEEAAAKSTAEKVQKAMEEGGDWRSLLGHDDGDDGDEIPIGDIEKLFSDESAMNALKEGLDKQRAAIMQEESNRY